MTFVVDWVLKSNYLSIYILFIKYALLIAVNVRGCLLGGVYVPCINRMPGGVNVGDYGLCCVPVQSVTLIVRVNYFPSPVDFAVNMVIN